MILVEIRVGSDEVVSLAVHPKVTVLSGLSQADRGHWGAELTRALRGQAPTMVVDVVVDGVTEPLTSEAARRLGLHEMAASPMMLPGDVPGARSPAPPQATTSTPTTQADTEAGVEAAQAAVAGCEAALAEAEAAAAPPADDGVPGARDAVSLAEEEVEQSRSRTERAGVTLAEARQAEGVALALDEARRVAVAAAVEQLTGQRVELEASRLELLARLADSGDPGDPEPVRQALVALGRLRAVKPRASHDAALLLDRWMTLQAVLVELPGPPPAPEELAGPALRALVAARHAVAKAESSTGPADPELVAAVERARVDVVQAEKKAMRKRSRLNRQRVEEANATLAGALAALSVASYGEFEQFVAESSEVGASEELVEAARLALTDAELVWQELHAGGASAQWTAAKEDELALKMEAAALLGRDVTSDDLETALAAHRETVVDPTWAEHELADALHTANASVAEGEDLAAAAERWLAESPAHRDIKTDLTRQLDELDARLATLVEQLSGHQADMYFNATASGPDTAGPPTAEGELFESLEEAVSVAEQAEAEAVEALSATRQELVTREERLKAEAEAKAIAVDAAGARLEEARTALDDARRAAAVALEPPAASPVPAVDLGGVLATEVEVYLLARLIALRAHPRLGTLPLILDAGVVAGLPEGASARVVDLLERAANTTQVVVLGEEDEVTEWVGRLGQRSTAHLPAFVDVSMPDEPRG